MNFSRPLDLTAKTNNYEETVAERTPAWCDSLLNVKAIISNHELLLDWNNEDLVRPWRWRNERSPAFFSLKRKLSEFVNDEDSRVNEDDERSGPSDDPDFFVFNCDMVSEEIVLKDESSRNENANSPPPTEKRESTHDLNNLWSEESYSPINENLCWRFNCDSVASSTLEILEMLLEDWDLKNCLREVDPELESVTSCIEVSFLDELDGEEDHTSDAVDPDTDMFSPLKDVEEEDTSCYENLVEYLSMSDDDDEKDSGINEEIGESLTEDNSICVLLREKTPKDYSQVKGKTKRRSTTKAVNTTVEALEKTNNKANLTKEVNEKASEILTKNQHEKSPPKTLIRATQENADEEVSGIYSHHRNEETPKATLKEGFNIQKFHENVAMYPPQSPVRKKLKCDSDRTISVNETDIPDLSDLLNRDSGFGDTPTDKLECFSDSDHDDLLIVCD